MRLKTSAEEAKKELLSIPHSTCAKAVEEHWKVDQNGAIRAQSVLWLFCWAKTGMNSEHARVASVRVFDKIMPISFADLDSLLDHEYARKGRYVSHDIEDEFRLSLARAH